MVSQLIRAIYHDGQLRLLDPVDLSEGQDIQLMILSDAERVRAALGDLLLERIVPANDDVDEEALMREIKEASRGQPPLSDDIIAERREGP